MNIDPKENLIIGLKQIDRTLDGVFAPGGVGFFKGANVGAKVSKNPQSIEAYKETKASVKHLTDLAMDALMRSHAPKFTK